VKRAATLLLILVAVASPAAGEDRRLVGTWKAVSYVINGEPHPMQGLFIFSKRHYSANIRFRLGDQGAIDNSNGNAGPYAADGKRIVFSQWVQIHVRPHDKEPILSRAGPDEATDYRIEGKRLVLTFPSKNQYILERLPE